LQNLKQWNPKRLMDHVNTSISLDEKNYKNFKSPTFHNLSKIIAKTNLKIMLPCSYGEMPYTLSHPYSLLAKNHLKVIRADL
jgi:hypothetical protein